MGCTKLKSGSGCQSYDTKYVETSPISNGRDYSSTLAALYTKAEAINALKTLDAKSANWEKSKCKNWAACNACKDKTGRRCWASTCNKKRCQSCPNRRCAKKYKCPAVCKKVCRNGSTGTIGTIIGSTLLDVAWCSGGISYKGRGSYDVPLRTGSDGGTLKYPTTFNQCQLNREEPNGDKLVICTKGIAEHPDQAHKSVAVVGYKVAACWVPGFLKKLAGQSGKMVCHNVKKARCVRCQTKIWDWTDTWASLGTRKGTVGGKTTLSWGGYVERLFAKCGTFKACSKDDQVKTRLHLGTV